MDSNSVIIPFCIYQNDQQQVRLAASKKTVNGNFICPKTIEPGWKLKSTFYAVNPMLKPIPEGMNLFFAESNPKPPYDTKKINIVYNTLDTQNKGVYFICYATRVINTVPLYFDNIDGKMYISLKEPKITKNENTAIFTQNLSPIFVFQRELFPDGEFKFLCNNGRCIPNNKNESIFNVGKSGKPTSLEKCSVECSLLTPLEEGGGKPQTISSILTNFGLKKRNFEQNFKRAFKKVPSWTFSLLFLLLILFLGIVLYISLY